MENDKTQEIMTEKHLLLIGGGFTSKSASLVENSIYSDLETLTKLESGNIFIVSTNKYQTDLIVNRIERDIENRISYRLIEFKNIAINCLGLKRSYLEEFETYYRLSSEFKNKSVLEKNLVGQETVNDLLEDTIIIFSICPSELQRKEIRLLEEFYGEVIDRLVSDGSAKFKSRYLLFPTKKVDVDLFLKQNKSCDKIVIQNKI